LIVLSGLSRLIPTADQPDRQIDRASGVVVQAIESAVTFRLTLVVLQLTLACVTSSISHDSRSQFRFDAPFLLVPFDVPLSTAPPSASDEFQRSLVHPKRRQTNRQNGRVSFNVCFCLSRACLDKRPLFDEETASHARQKGAFSRTFCPAKEEGCLLLCVL
jgi:hypothetical protein